MLPPQALESLQASFENTAGQHPSVHAAGAAAALGVTLWYLSRQLLILRRPRVRWRVDLRDALERWTPRVLGLLPSLGLALASRRIRDQTVDTADPVWRQAHDSSLLNLALAVILITAFTARRALLERRRRRRGPPPEAVHLLRHRIDLPPLTIVLLSALTLVASLLAVMPVAFPTWAQQIGPTVVVITALAAWAGLLLVPVALANVRRWPVLLLLAGAGLLWEGLDLSDNHRVRRLDAPHTAPPPPLVDAFRDWLADPPRRDAPRPFPVVLVATEGGGIRAAYFTAQVLSRLHEHSGGRFADHLFAVSGVSGGAVGAAVFAGLLNAPGPTDRAASRALRDDLLASVLASGLVADTAHRVLPLGALADPLDRARTLEDALAAGVAAALDPGAPNPLEEGLRRAWSARRGPLLLLNTTLVETGERLVVAPVVGEPHIPRGRLRFFFDEFPGVGDLPVKTAACLAARFPYVTPPGWALNPPGADAGEGRLGPGKHRMVDGGYFENSGTATLLDVLDALRDSGADARFILVTIWYREAEPVPRHGFGELWSPPEALINTRPGRGKLSRQLLRDAAGAGGPIEFVLEKRDSRLPLGWHLSEASKRDIGLAAEDLVCGAPGQRLIAELAR
jgi:hypothetical protein